MQLLPSPGPTELWTKPGAPALHADNLISATLALGEEASLCMRGNPSPLNSEERNHTIVAPQVSTAADVLHIPKRKGLLGSEAWATGRCGTKGCICSLWAGSRVKPLPYNYVSISVAGFQSSRGLCQVGLIRRSSMSRGGAASNFTEAWLGKSQHLHQD